MLDLGRFFFLCGGSDISTAWDEGAGCAGPG